MKKVTAVVRPEKFDELKAALNAQGIVGMTTYDVRGCGSQHGHQLDAPGDEKTLNLLPKVKIELVVRDNQVENIINVICCVARTGHVGDGKIFVSPVEQCVRIRTGERWDAAV